MSLVHLVEIAALALVGWWVGIRALAWLLVFREIHYETKYGVPSRLYLMAERWEYEQRGRR